MDSTLDSRAVDRANFENLRLYTTSHSKPSPVTNQTVTGSRLTGYIVNVMRSPVIKRLMVRGSQVALKHVIHDMETRTLVMELCRRQLKDRSPVVTWIAGQRSIAQPRLQCGFRTTPEGVSIFLKAKYTPNYTVYQKFLREAYPRISKQAWGFNTNIIYCIESKY